MKAKLRIIFFCVGALVSGSWGANDAHQPKDEDDYPPLWYQLQQAEIRRDRIGSTIFLWFTAFMIVGTVTLNYFLAPQK